MGISLEETNASNTLSKGIQENITEETANILASYINGIRADVSVKRALLEKLGNEIFPKVQHSCRATTNAIKSDS